MCLHTIYHCKICDKGVTLPPLPTLCAAAKADDFVPCKPDSSNNVTNTVETTHFGDCLKESSRRDREAEKAREGARKKDEEDGYWSG
jgi:hypothetical protein